MLNLITNPWKYFFVNYVPDQQQFMIDDKEQYLIETIRKSFL